MLWSKIIATVQPVAFLAEVLRQHRARMVLKSLFAIQLVRYAKRMTYRRDREKWLAHRLENMKRPTLEALCKAVPLLQHLPFSKQAELQQELEPICFKAKEYMSYSSLRAQAIQPSKKQLQRGLGRPNMDQDPMPLATAAAVGATSNTTNATNSQGNRKRKEFKNEKMIFISSGSAVSYSVLAGHHAPGPSGAADSKLTEYFMEGNAIGLEALMGADVKRHVTIARTDIDGWCIPLQRIHEMIDGTGGSVADMLQALATERRKEAMRLIPLNPEALRQSSPVLSEWSNAGVQSLIHALSPAVFHRGDVVPLKGIYFIIRGRVELIDAKDETPAREGRRNQGGAGLGAGATTPAFSLLGVPTVTSPLSGAPSPSTTESGNPAAHSTLLSVPNTHSTGNSTGQLRNAPAPPTTLSSSAPVGSGDQFRSGQCCGITECFLVPSHSRSNQQGPRYPQKLMRVLADSDCWFAKRADFLDLSVHEDLNSLLPLFPAAFFGPSGGGSGGGGAGQGGGGAGWIGHHGSLDMSSSSLLGGIGEGKDRGKDASRKGLGPNGSHTHTTPVRGQTPRSRGAAPSPSVGPQRASSRKPV
jgi:hypothetical protein